AFPTRPRRRRTARARAARRPRGTPARQGPPRRMRAPARAMARRRSPPKSSIGWRAMPIHVRAEPGDYAEAVLLPGDPLRAKYIADTCLDGVLQTNSERGMLGFRGTWEGKPVSVQATGMGCPSAAIVIEELVMLGCKRLLRVGTCGGLQPNHQLGDMIVALTAVPQDGTVHTYVKEPHCP